uniref:AP-1 complex subunit mu-2-like n=2 Tax=Nicotiana TaxID=4085 RepID=A0A1S4C2I9_TOBAC|nr:PREDICTED: AP-1 complex subunit mu-2-like [Nicotiana sylvestris]XP_016495278.1 PREDICTED: AP-1 complex subunit mu-2-like [Nicotiana tabacum]
MEVTQRPPMAVTNAVSWRSEGIQYKKNEVFLDVVESVNILVNSNGQIVRSSFVLATSRHHDQQCSRIRCILISVYSSLAFYVILHTELFLAIFRF